MSFVVAVTDYVFASLEPERAVLEPLVAELRPRQCRSEEEIIELTREADGILNCYAKITARVSVVTQPGCTQLVSLLEAKPWISTIGSPVPSSR